MRPGGAGAGVRAADQRPAWVRGSRRRCSDAVGGVGCLEWVGTSKGRVNVHSHRARGGPGRRGVRRGPWPPPVSGCRERLVGVGRRGFGAAGAGLRGPADMSMTGTDPGSFGAPSGSAMSGRAMPQQMGVPGVGGDARTRSRSRRAGCGVDVPGGPVGGSAGRGGSYEDCRGRGRLGPAGPGVRVPRGEPEYGAPGGGGGAGVAETHLNNWGKGLAGGASGGRPLPGGGDGAVRAAVPGYGRFTSVTTAALRCDQPGVVGGAAGDAGGDPQGAATCSTTRRARSGAVSTVAWRSGAVRRPAVRGTARCCRGTGAAVPVGGDAGRADPGAGRPGDRPG